MTDRLKETTIHAALAAAVTDVLESMFFIETFEESSESPEAPATEVEIRFDGDPPGRFQMRLAPEAAQCFAADFLGEDAGSVSERQSADVALELANMICGAVLSRLESSACFRLDSPRIVLAGGLAEAAEASRFTVETGNGRLTAAIQWGGRTCLATAEYVS
ncbi:MAG: chemotaxis protein CheX [Candidatus Solibacter sp.]